MSAHSVNFFEEFNKRFSAIREAPGGEHDGVSIDCLTRVPADLFNRLLQEGKRDRGQHRLRRTASRRWHLVRSHSISAGAGAQARSPSARTPRCAITCAAHGGKLTLAGAVSSRCGSGQVRTASHRRLPSPGAAPAAEVIQSPGKRPRNTRAAPPALQGAGIRGFVRAATSGGFSRSPDCRQRRRAPDVSTAVSLLASRPGCTARSVSPAGRRPLRW